MEEQSPVGPCHTAPDRDRDPSNNDDLFALAEMSFHQAESGNAQPYSLAAVAYAFAFLFPSDPKYVPNAFDPRVRSATDIDNRSLTSAFATCCVACWKGKVIGRKLGHGPKSDRLTPKVLAFVAEGRSYRLVGREVGLSKNTVAVSLDVAALTRPIVATCWMTGFDP